MASTTFDHRAVMPAGPGQDAGSASPCLRHDGALDLFGRSSIGRWSLPRKIASCGASALRQRVIPEQPTISSGRYAHEVPYHGRTGCRGATALDYRPKLARLRARHIQWKQRRDYFSPYSIRKKACRTVFCQTLGIQLREADSADSRITTGLGQRRMATV